MTLAPAPFIPATGSLSVEPWPDPVIDSLGLDPRSHYVETYWLGTLGPSTTWLLRRLATGLEASPGGFVLDLPSCARELGLGDKGGRHSPFARSLARLVQFEIARWQPSTTTLEVRRRVPPLNRRQVMYLPDALRASHDDWQRAQLAAPPETMRQRCVQLAAVLLATGEERESAERQLHQWGYHPALAYESVVLAATAPQA
ncbi:MAG: hypothetical protein Q8K63_03695 [Acidimicrobiales bacterium]|nr:hypothetical protein [Acidimicrobiales bacterium]